jgi:hypothetical protein
MGGAFSPPLFLSPFCLGLSPLKVAAVCSGPKLNFFSSTTASLLHAFVRLVYCSAFGDRWWALAVWRSEFRGLVAAIGKRGVTISLLFDQTPWPSLPSLPPLRPLRPLRPLLPLSGGLGLYRGRLSSSAGGCLSRKKRLAACIRCACRILRSSRTEPPSSCTSLRAYWW